MRYTKQTLTLAEQIRTLQTRGLIIENEADATIVLEHISYFRLALLMKYPTINPVMMGFPHSWSVEPLWK